LKVLVSYMVGMAGLAVILSVILLATRWDSLWMHYLICRLSGAVTSVSCQVLAPGIPLAVMEKDLLVLLLFVLVIVLNSVSIMVQPYFLHTAISNHHGSAVTPIYHCMFSFFSVVAAQMFLQELGKVTVPQ
jgi:hypothetical protein